MITTTQIYNILGRCIQMDRDPQMGGIIIGGQQMAADAINALIAEDAPKPSKIQDAIDALVAEALVTKTHANTMNGLIVQLRGLLDKRDRALDMAIRAGTGSLGPRGVVDAAKAFEAYLSGQ